MFSSYSDDDFNPLGNNLEEKTLSSKDTHEITTERVFHQKTDSTFVDNNGIIYTFLDTGAFNNVYYSKKTNTVLKLQMSSSRDCDHGSSSNLKNKEV